jgi:VCBS repeat-containing protein
VDTKEEFVAPPRCTNKLSSDHNAGDKASSVKVTVVATCTGEVYDRQGAEKVAADLLKQEEVQNFSASYALVGTIATVVVKVTVVNADKGTVSLQVKARGLWVYQFDATQKQRLTKLIVGKTAQDAIKVLKKQDGVSKIQISGDVGTLPTDPTKIIIKIGSV